MSNIVIGKFSNSGLGDNNIVIGNGTLLTTESNTLLIDLDDVKVKIKMTDTQSNNLLTLFNEILKQNSEDIFVNNKIIKH